MNKCDIMNIEKCKKIGKICNNVTGRCIKDKNVENVYKINKYRHRQKMAIFDYDWTLVKPKSNGTFAKNENDWVWLTEKVPIIIKELYDKGYSINIISNQRKNTITKIKEINNALSSFLHVNPEEVPLSLLKGFGGRKVATNCCIMIFCKDGVLQFGG